MSEQIYCRFCGKKLVNGRCDCEGFLADNAETAAVDDKAYEYNAAAEAENDAFNDEGQGRQAASYEENAGSGYAGQAAPFEEDAGSGYAGQAAPFEEDAGSGYAGQAAPYEEDAGSGYAGQSASYEEDGPQMENTGTDGKEPFLNREYHPDFSSFSAFISSVRNLSGSDEPVSAAGDPYEHNVPIVPDCVSAEENEIVVKQYNIARLRTRLQFTAAEGRLMVTNRRVLFRASGKSPAGNVVQEHQFDLDDIGGVELNKNYKISFLNVIGSILLYFVVLVVMMAIFPAFTFRSVYLTVGLILGVFGIAATIIINKHPWLKLLCIYIGTTGFMYARAVTYGNILCWLLVILSVLVLIIDLIIVWFVPNFILEIKTNGALGAIRIGSGKSLLKRRADDTDIGFAEVLPWEDTILAINELGTLIDDLQKHGDYAIEKWTQQ